MIQNWLLWIYDTFGALLKYLLKHYGDLTTTAWNLIFEKDNYGIVLMNILYEPFSIADCL